MSRHFSFLVVVALAVLCGALSWVVSETTLAKHIELLTYDSHFRLRGEEDSPRNIVVVAIDEASLAEQEGQWPWPRSIHAKLLESLKRAGARTVAFDLLFAESSRGYQDQEFASAIARFQEPLQAAGNTSDKSTRSVVLVSDINSIVDSYTGVEQTKVIEPTPITDLLMRKPYVGYDNIAVDTDNTARSLYLTIGDDKAFSLQAASSYLGRAVETTNVEDDRRYWINYSGGARSILTVSYYQALEPKKYLPEGIFDDALVFVGFALYSEVSAENKPPDHYAVPFSRFYGGYMPGVEIHAHAAASLMEEKGVRHIDIPIWIFPLLTFVSTLLFIYFRSLTGVLLYANFLAAMTFSSAYLFQDRGIYISPAMIIVSVSIAYFVSPFVHYFLSQRQRKFLKNAFSSYLSPALVAELVKNPEKLELGGKEADVTVLFLDISGFTSLSEKVSASELISLMNRVLGGFAEVIIGNNGYIDKFIGDAIMAVWGVPVPCAHSQEFAVGTAVEIIEKLKELNEQIVAESGVPLAVRVGVASGRVVAGNVGGAGRLNYTVLGNSVNLSSRLEGANKQYGSSILIDRATAVSLDEDFKYYHQLTAIDRIRVKGQETTVEIYTMVDIGAHAKKLFERGVSFYDQRAWKAAHKLFHDVLKIEPSFSVASELARRCEYYFDNPPLDDWDGVYAMTEK